MDKNTKSQLGNITIFAGIALFLSAYWVEDKKTAVSRRYVGMILAGAGLVIKPLK